MSKHKETTKINGWWLASTSFPVLAGTLGAMAIMFSICTVSQGWQEAVDVDGNTRTLSQPAWAVVLKAVSLALATIAHFVLLLTMKSKRDPVIGFTVTILSWLAAAVILFSLIGVVAQHHPTLQPQESLRHTQNFYYGILAASLYVLIAILLAIYTASARTVRLSQKDRRTIECTSIILRTITFMAILLGGAAMYSSVEGWSFMDALYFTDYTLLTLGIGNIVPRTHLGRSLLFPYATAGIITAGLVISSIASFGKNMRNMKLRFKLEEAQIAMHKQGDSDGLIDSTRKDSEKQSPYLPASAQFPSRNQMLKLHLIKSSFHRKQRWKALVIFLVAWFVLWIVSAGIFYRSESSQGWSYFVALYFTYTSLTTIGYGDFYPTSNFGKVFFVFWSLLAVPILTNLVTAMGEIGHLLLVYVSNYVWRLGMLRAHERQHRQHGISLSHGEKGRNGPNQRLPSGLERSTGVSRSQGLIVSKQAPRDLQQISAESSSSGNQIKLPKSVNKCVQHKLLLTDEIQILIAALMDESITLNLAHNWIRIHSSVLPRENEELDSLHANPLPDLHERIPIDSKTSLADRNTEILWMLKFLVEKLCADLREELYKETE
ncbi:TOK2 potassium channel [Xylogone sp. PMI_703]|nr:TOK2 potassium channel [Xylogone sp. PMI_703]